MAERQRDERKKGRMKGGQAEREKERGRMRERGEGCK